HQRGTPSSGSIVSWSSTRLKKPPAPMSAKDGGSSQNYPRPVPSLVGPLLRIPPLESVPAQASSGRGRVSIAARGISDQTDGRAGFATAGCTMTTGTTSWTQSGSGTQTEPDTMV